MELKQGKLLKFNKPKTFFELSGEGELINIYAIKCYAALDKKVIISVHEHTNQAINIKDVDHLRFLKWLKSWGIDSNKKIKPKK